MDLQTREEIFLKDYQAPNYWIESTDLVIDIGEDKCFVEAKIHFVKNKEQNQNQLVLNGTELKLLKISINTRELDSSSYTLDAEKVILENLEDDFILETKVEIDPFKNFSGEGLYVSGDILCSQCEAEGFRRITYYPDRPDVMSKFRVKLQGHKEKFPYLLANGNIVDSGDLPDGRHFVCWEDPFKKPSYLFAVVAGDLALVEDQFTTMSGKDILLQIYVDKGNEDKCFHAMESLKKAMKWDEEVYGLEYDLSRYMIVAVDSFNMGAMENKGLNIFNSSYVLAKQETATDADFLGIESVIGHEYFHNWTGNRVTCRDWFQLTLKEGLTVFRDQCFSHDMGQGETKRIEDVKFFKSRQFVEDAGPLRHPIRPRSFIEINNFYTLTIYEKGAEVIRMIHTLLGAKNFRAGMDLYFKRHDGQAVTTHDFIMAMSDASGLDLSLFENWYDQVGTPTLKVSKEYESSKKLTILTVEQEADFATGEEKVLHLPFHMKAITKNGQEVRLENAGQFEIKEQLSQFIFKDVPEDAIFSFNTDFSAPVKIDYTYTDEEMSLLMSHGPVPLDQYFMIKKVATKEVLRLREALSLSREAKVSEEFLASFGHILRNNELSFALKAYLLEMPGLAEINEQLSIYDFDHLPVALEVFYQQIAQHYYSELNQLCLKLTDDGAYRLDSESIGKRSLKFVIFSLLAYAKKEEVFKSAFELFQKANNMTEESQYMRLLISHENSYRETAKSSFYEKWKTTPLVLQKWLYAVASSKLTTLKEMEQLENLPEYHEKIPNELRSLLGGFQSNDLQFHTSSGQGYAYFVDTLLRVDSFNPQIAARMARGLNFLSKLEGKSQANLRAQLIRMKEKPGLSNDLYEVVTKNLA